MLQLTRKTDYALIAMTALAGEVSPVSARDLAERHSLSQPLLANVLKDLGAAGLVSSVRGKHGGYRLAADPAFVSIGQVIEALEGPFQLAGCTGTESAAGCEISGCCTVKWTVRSIHDAMVEILRKVTIADVVSHARAGAAGVLSETDVKGLEFHEVPLNLEV